MKKRTLIEYLQGVTESPVTEQVEAWIMQDTAHLEYFTRLRDTYVSSIMPNQLATDGQMEIARKIMSGSAAAGTAGRCHIKWHYISVSVAAAVLVALVMNLHYMHKLRRENMEEHVLPLERIALNHIPAAYTHTIYTNKGAKSEIVLPDGSKVKLNSDTKLIFPDKFIGPTREVYVTGEAFFDVKANVDTPMIVNTGKDMMIKVMGTKFNIRAYENESSAKATLYNGKIDVLKKVADGEPQFMASMKPNESYELRELKAPLKVLKADTLKSSAWTRGDLIFELTPLEGVLKELERWHGADFTIENKEIFKHSFSANFRQESLTQILEVLKFCTGIDYTIDGNNVRLK